MRDPKGWGAIHAGPGLAVDQPVSGRAVPGGAPIRAAAHHGSWLTVHAEDSGEASKQASS
jgi:hypothetical protein